jgi:hypothetical protein
VKLERYALVAEIVGGIAIVISLAILIVEVRGNTQAIRNANRQSLATRAQDMALILAADPDIADSLKQAVSANEMDQASLARATNFMMANLRIAEEAYYLYREGELDEDYWRTRAAVVLDALRSQALRDQYTSFKDRGFFTPDFTAWLDRVLAETYDD